jgi:small subunit ribosomal protein S13
MPRVLGIDIPANKPIEYSLRSIYGIGPTISVKVLENAGIDRTRRTHTLSEEELAVIAKAISTTTMRPEQTRTKDGVILVEGELKMRIKEDDKRLKSIKSYRGLRHARGLPVRGQRTQTNARTRKGPKKTVGAQSKKV